MGAAPADAGHGEARRSVPAGARGWAGRGRLAGQDQRAPPERRAPQLVRPPPDQGSAPRAPGRGAAAQASPDLGTTRKQRVERAPRAWTQKRWGRHSWRAERVAGPHRPRLFAGRRLLLLFANSASSSSMRRWARSRSARARSRRAFSDSMVARASSRVMSTADHPAGPMASDSSSSRELRSMNLRLFAIVPSSTRRLRVQAVEQRGQEVRLQVDLSGALRDGW